MGHGSRSRALTMANGREVRVLRRLMDWHMLAGDAGLEDRIFLMLTKRAGSEDGYAHLAVVADRETRPVVVGEKKEFTITGDMGLVILLLGAGLAVPTRDGEDA